MEGIENLLSFIERKWEHISGLIAAELLICFVVYNIASIYITNVKYTTLLVVVVCIVFMFFWLIHTAHIVLPSRKFIVDLYVYNDEDAERIIRKSVAKTIKEINENHRQIRVVRRPYNTFKEDGSSVKYRLWQDGIVLAAKVNGGRDKDNVKAEVCSFIVGGKFPKNDILGLYKTKLSFKHDFGLRTSCKDWEYVESNSFNDNKKMTSNLNDVILFSVGVVKIYQKDLSFSLNILKKLAGQDNVIQNNSEQKLKMSNLSNTRLKSIVVDLFMLVAIREYNNHNPHKAFSLLRECESLYSDIVSKSMDIYIPLARFSFECGEIELSKYYTEKLYLLKDGKFFYYLNKGFYAIIENDKVALYENYIKVANYSTSMKKENMVDVVDFLEKHRNHYPQSDALFDFAEGFISRLFYDKEEGASSLLAFKDKHKDEDCYANLIKLCDKALNKQPSLYGKHIRHKSKRKKIKRH